MSENIDDRSTLVYGDKTPRRSPLLPPMIEENDPMTVQWMDAESIDLILIGCPSSNDQSQDSSGESGVEDIPKF